MGMACLSASCQTDMRRTNEVVLPYKTFSYFMFEMMQFTGVKCVTS